MTLQPTRWSGLVEMLALVNLEDQKLNQILFGVTRIQLATAELLLTIAPAEKVIPSTGKLHESCANLTDRPKI